MMYYDVLCSWWKCFQAENLGRSRYHGYLLLMFFKSKLIANEYLIQVMSILLTRATHVTFTLVPGYSSGSTGGCLRHSCNVGH